MAAVDHDRGVAGTKSLHAAVIAVTMIQVQRHGNLGALGRSLDHAVEVIETGSLNGARSGLHDDGRLGLLGSLEHSHDELEVLDVKGTHAVVVLLCVEQHLLGGNEHNRSLLHGTVPALRHRASPREPNVDAIV